MTTTISTATTTVTTVTAITTGTFELYQKLLNSSCLSDGIVHPGCQKGLSSMFQEQIGENIKLAHSENVEGDIELKVTICIPVVSGSNYNV